MVTVPEDVFLALRELPLFAGVPSRDGTHISDNSGIDLDVSRASGDGTGVDEFLSALGAVTEIGWH
jgi:hypothetical protein